MISPVNGKNVVINRFFNKAYKAYKGKLYLVNEISMSVK